MTKLELPNRKVSVAGLAGALITLSLGIASRFDINFSGEEGAAMVWLVGFGLAYFIREAPPSGPAK
jgi:hypothetical protein